jgi:ABC-2 type transport system permease protein
VGPVSAAPVANLVFLPLSFASGLLVPLGMLPAIVREIAPYLPAYHLGQLGWTVIGAGDGTGLGRHVLWLVAYGALFALLAFVAWRRDEGRVFD